MKVFLEIFLILICNQTFCQKEDSLELWTLFTSGDFINENAHKITVRSWPFRYISKAGDTFDDELEAEVAKHNEKLWNILIQQGYIDPEKKYYEQYEKERARIELAQKLVINDSRFHKLNISLASSKRVNYTNLIKKSDNLYIFEIFSYDIKDLSKGQRFEIRLIVELNKQKN